MTKNVNNLCVLINGFSLNLYEVIKPMFLGNCIKKYTNVLYGHVLRRWKHKLSLLSKSPRVIWVLINYQAVAQAGI